MVAAVRDDVSSLEHEDFVWPCYGAQEVCESRGGRSGLPVPNRAHGLCGRKATLNLVSISELRRCVKVEVAVLGFLYLTGLMVSVDVKQR